MNKKTRDRLDRERQIRDAWLLSELARCCDLVGAADLAHALRAVVRKRLDATALKIRPPGATVPTA